MGFLLYNSTFFVCLKFFINDFKSLFNTVVEFLGTAKMRKRNKSLRPEVEKNMIAYIEIKKPRESTANELNY